MRSYRAVVLSGLAAMMLAACGGSSGGGTTKYILTVTKAGSGTVTSSPAGIDCGSTCAAKFAKGASVTLSAAADTGSTFAGWSGGGCTGTAATCVVTVTANTTVAATFNAIHPTLRVFAWGGGSTSPAPGVHSYNYGDKVTLTATPDANHTFTGWSGAASGTTATTVVTLTNDVLVGARFWSGTPGASALPPAPGSANVAKPSGAVGGLKVLDWAGYKAAFSLTFDDARSSQSWSDNYAQMKAEGIPMTFYVIPSEAEKTADRLAFWQGVAADGQEIGNHTVNHCSVSTAGVLSGCAYGTKAADATAMQQLDEASAWIEAKLGVKGVFTMATPNGDGNWAPFAEKAGFIAVRSINAGTMAPNDLSKEFALTDSFMGKEYGGKGEAATDLNAQIDSARTAGGWTTALVHKWLPAATPVDGGDSCCQMAVSDMVTSLRYLKSLGDVWGDTVTAVASYWIGQDLLSTATPTTAGGVTTWHWTLPPNFPPNKYVRVTVTGGVLSQGNHALAWNSHGYYEVALDAGQLSLAAAPTHAVAVTKTGTGSGMVTSSPAGINCGATCSAQFAEGSAVTLSAVAQGTGATFDGWSGACTGTGDCVVNVATADVAVTATFSNPIPTHSLSVALAGTGTGTVSGAGLTCSGAACDGVYAENTVVTLTAAASADSVFAGWSGACTGVTPTCEVTLSADATATATFDPAAHSLTVTPAGTGAGTVTSSSGDINCGSTCSAQFPNGTSVTLSAAALPGSKFYGWSGGGCSGTDGCTVALGAETTVTATFATIFEALNTYALPYAWISQGTQVTGSPATATKGGLACTQFTGTSGAVEGGIAFEVQYDVDGDPVTDGNQALDITGAHFKLTYDFWLDSATQSPTYVQASVWDGSYQPKMFDTGSGDSTKLDQWQSVSVTLDPAAPGYTASNFSATGVAKIRLKVLTQTAGNSVIFCLKNLKVSNE